MGCVLWQCLPSASLFISPKDGCLSFHYLLLQSCSRALLPIC